MTNKCICTSYLWNDLFQAVEAQTDMKQIYSFHVGSQYNLVYVSDSDKKG